MDPNTIIIIIIINPAQLTRRSEKAPPSNKCLLISAAPQNVAFIKNLVNLTGTKLNCLWREYTKYEKIKIVLGCQILHIINVSYVLLPGKRILQSLGVLCE